jgi:hypothetical protein
VPGPQFLLKTLLNSAASSWLFAEISLLWITEQYFFLLVVVLEIGPVVSTQVGAGVVMVLVSTFSLVTMH